MSFHKVTPVRKNRKPAAPAEKRAARPTPKKQARNRRPVGHQG
ncbi:hypothetical protein [Streptomyces sp. NPDC003635]